MKSSDLVTVVIPSFNAESFLADAVRSALSQSHSNVEVVVVDDGSVDSTAEVAASFGKDVRLERIQHRGPSAARNRGLSIARGSFIQFLDADDLLLPEKIERCLTAFEDDIQAVFCRYVYFDDSSGLDLSASGMRGFLLGRLLRTRSMNWDPNRLPEFVLRSEIGTPGPLHRVEGLRACGGFREDLCNLEDIELHLRLALSGARFKRIDAVWVRCRAHRSAGRLRNQPDAQLNALRGLHALREEISTSPRATPRLTRALADAYGFRARKLYEQGHVADARRAWQSAKELHPHPRASAVPLYNALSRVMGFERLEKARLAAKRVVPGWAR